tara:strand:- start:11329 stop:11940 length:612 start_codon:yes stop_codon:yes gene_type:complete
MKMIKLGTFQYREQAWQNGNFTICHRGLKSLKFDLDKNFAYDVRIYNTKPRGESQVVLMVLRSDPYWDSGQGSNGSFWKRPDSKINRWYRFDAHYIRDMLKKMFGLDAWDPCELYVKVKKLEEPDPKFTKEELSAAMFVISVRLKNIHPTFAHVTHSDEEIKIHFTDGTPMESGEFAHNSKTRNLLEKLAGHLKLARRKTFRI